jgi:hypothetical protein
MLDATYWILRERVSSINHRVSRNALCIELLISTLYSLMANLSSLIAILQKTSNVKRETLNDARMHEERSQKSIEITNFPFSIFHFRFKWQIENPKSKIVYALRSALCPNPAPGREAHPHIRHKRNAGILSLES